MEALLASHNESGTGEHLVGPLKFGLDAQGSYVASRRQSTTFSNVNLASPEGVKTITINVGSSSEWLDPSTLLLSFLIKETANAHSLFPATPDPSCLFSRLQIRLGSTLVEDIQEYGKLSDIMTKLSMSPAKKMDLYQMGFGARPAQSSNSYFEADNHLARLITKNESKRVYMKFNLSGLFTQEKWIPLYALGGQGLQIQLTLAEAKKAVVVSNGGVTYSHAYQLSDIRLLADMCTLTGEL